MSKSMTLKEKFIFLLSFIWALHWGVRLSFLIISHITGQWGKSIPEPQKAPVKTPADTSKDTKETLKKKS